MKKCILVMTDSDLVSKLYDDDEISGKYANPALVVENIFNPTFLGWEVYLSAIPAEGDCICLRPVRDYLIMQWTGKAANKDAAITYFLNMVKQEPQFSTYCYNSSGEQVDDAELIKRILCGVESNTPIQCNFAEGLFDGIMFVKKRIFVPGYDNVVLSVGHSL